MTQIALQIRYLDSGYAVADAAGNLIEHHIPTGEDAEDRLRLHAERIASLRAWDAAHPR